MSLRVQVRSIPRETIPADVFLGDHLVQLLEQAFEAGRTGAAGVVVRAHTVDGVDLAPVRAQGLPMPWFLAGLTTTVTEAGGPAEAVGVMGRVGHRRGAGSPAMSVATVFLEWEDNRWWHWQARLDPEGRLMADTATVRSAEDGDPMPSGLGRWWSHARRSHLRVGLTAIPGASGPTVH